MRSRPALGGGKRVGALERRQDPLALAQRTHAGERLLIARGLVTNAPDGREQRMLGTHPGVVEPCGDRMSLLDLAVLVLQQHRVRPMQHAGSSERDRRGVLAQARAATIALDRKSTRLNSSHRCISYAVFCLKKKKKYPHDLIG